jgi:hypothetical protein
LNLERGFPRPKQVLEPAQAPKPPRLLGDSNWYPSTWLEWLPRRPSEYAWLERRTYYRGRTRESRAVASSARRIKGILARLRGEPFIYPKKSLPGLRQ